MALVERFLRYVSFDTQSSEETRITPSTPGQMVFAKYLKSELESLGLEEITFFSPPFRQIRIRKFPLSVLLPIWIRVLI